MAEERGLPLTSPLTPLALFAYSGTKGSSLLTTFQGVAVALRKCSQIMHHAVFEQERVDSPTGRF